MAGLLGKNCPHSMLAQPGDHQLTMVSHLGARHRRFSRRFRRDPSHHKQACRLGDRTSSSWVPTWLHPSTLPARAQICSGGKAGRLPPPSLAAWQTGRPRLPCVEELPQDPTATWTHGMILLSFTNIEVDASPGQAVPGYCWLASRPSSNRDLPTAGVQQIAANETAITQK